MKTPSDDLFRIIKSLTPSEKRYFKVITSQRESGKASAYHALFDAIDSQEAYDELGLQKANRDARFSKNLSMAKIYLQESIVKALCTFHADSSDGISIEEKIKGAWLLQNRGLEDVSLKLLRQAEKIATKNDIIGVNLRLLNHKMRRRQTKPGDDSETEINSIYAAQLECLGDLRQELDIEWLRALGRTRFVNFGLARTEVDRAQIQQLLDHEIARVDPASLPSDRLRRILHDLHSSCYFTLGEYQKAYESGKESLRLWEEGAFSSKSKTQYAIMLHNFAMRCQRAKQIDSLETTLKKLRDLCRNDKSMRLFEFESVNVIEMSCLALQHRYREIVEMSPAVERDFEELREQVKESSRIAIFFSLGSISIFIGEYELALKHVNNLLNDEPSFPDLYNIIKLINLVVHIELGHFDLLPGLIRSTSRFLKKRERMLKVEDVLLRRLLKVPALAGTDKERSFYLQLASELREAVADDPGASTFEYFDFAIWAESKAEGRPMGELMRAAKG